MAMVKQIPTDDDFDAFDMAYARLCKQCERGAISPEERDNQILLLNVEWKDQFWQED